MKLITDVHAHYDEAVFNEDRDEVLRSLHEGGVAFIINSGSEVPSSERSIRLAEAYDFVWASVGVFPLESWTDNGGRYPGWLSEIERLAGHKKVCAIGEIGLDRHWSDEYIREQEEVFRQQMLWASEASLPVIIHVREAHDTVFRILDSLAGSGISMKGVFHAFSGSIETYRRIKTYGDFKIGIGGVITYKNAGIAATVKDIPLEDILLETDSPWLTPVPYRGKRNESAYLRAVAEKTAAVKETDTETVDRITTSNAKKLFNLR